MEQSSGLGNRVPVFAIDEQTRSTVSGNGLWDVSSEHEACICKKSPTGVMSHIVGRLKFATTRLVRRSYKSLYHHTCH
jgi:hypothetical protein